MTLVQPSRLRCAVAWLLVVAALAGVVAWVLPDLADAARHLAAGTAPTQRFDVWLTWSAAVALAGCALWAGYVTTVVVLDVVSRTGGAPRRVGVPDWGRRLVLAACGALVVGAVVPAGAQAAVAEPDPRRLHGLPLPERAEAPTTTDAIGRLLVRESAGPAAPPRPRPAPAPPLVADPVPDQAPDPAPDAGAAPPARPAADHHVVRPGESLWSVADDVLTGATGTAPSHREVADYWPRLHRANRALLGDDPDLITPGQHLDLPPAPAAGPTSLGEDSP